MSGYSETPSLQSGLPMTLKECKICRKVTPHQIRCGQGVTAFVCSVCIERAIAFELQRD